eukprot:TRINITY_DN25575_c0_g1_i2.p1 TRINITY_DN25575_c0_g1~~TRINITY_DN25575_c0_g1_i2.p1  ORF type:complete len:387 (+),score=63.08 TRINITY_DN25575_c0_g1_i2:77-1162(+)
MEPWAVGATLAGFMAVCFVLYTFIPESLRGRTAAVQKQTVRMWGVVDADFNWCEEDYTVPFLAELWNTVTNAFYLIPGLLGWRFHPWMPREVAAMLAVLAAIAVGSALFHGTLRYWAQLADELPMHVLVVACVYSLATRDSSSSTSPRRPILVPAIVAAEVALVAGLYATQRTSLPHLALRGWLSVTFASGFVYIFFASAATAREVDAALSGQRGWKNGAAVRLFRGAFALMVAGLFCWICDIMLCPLLHKLTRGGGWRSDRPDMIICHSGCPTHSCTQSCGTAARRRECTLSRCCSFYITTPSAKLTNRCRDCGGTSGRFHSYITPSTPPQTASRVPPRWPTRLARCSTSTTALDRKSAH